MTASPRARSARAQTVLDGAGRTGWRPSLRLDLADGPCESISSLGGNGVRTIGGPPSTGKWNTIEHHLSNGRSRERRSPHHVASAT